MKLEVEMTKMVTFKFGEIHVTVDEQYLDDFQYFAETALVDLENQVKANPKGLLSMRHLVEALDSAIEYMEADKIEWMSGFEDEQSKGELEENYQSTLEHLKSLTSIFEATLLAERG